MPLIDCNEIDILEVVKIPQTYIAQDSTLSSSDSQEQIDRTSTKFERFLGAMLHTNVKMGFRIQSIAGQSNLYYLAEQCKAELLSSAFSAQFSGFDIQNRQNSLSYQIEFPIYLTEVTGVPILSKCALD